MSLSVTIAAPFKQAHKEHLKKSEIVYYLAFKQHWMNIEQANRIIARALEEGLVEASGDMIHPLFDISLVDIPPGYKPGPSVFERADPVDDLMLRISRQAGLSRGAVVAEVNRIVQEKFSGNLMTEAAVVILARKYQVEFQDLLPSLRDHVLKSP
ncbi:MAG: DUF2240 family protein [Methanolinea sp.]|nr:DUF2240 family protein [Methanolinea sp.]